MSKADVLFFRENSKAADLPALPGDEKCFSFRCPRADRRCGKLVIAGRSDLKRDGTGKAGTPMWEWQNAPNRKDPTFHPSVNCTGCWHGYIRDGQCVSTDGNPEPEIERKNP